MFGIVPQLPLSAAALDELELVALAELEPAAEEEELDEDSWHPHVYDMHDPMVQDQWGTANPMNELVAKESFNDVDPGLFAAPPL